MSQIVLLVLILAGVGVVVGWSGSVELIILVFRDLLCV